MNETPTTDAAWLRDLAAEALAWVEQRRFANNPGARTDAYADLTFAFGLARVGDADKARELMGRARVALDGGSEAHTWLYKAYEYRIKQALDGRSPTGPLPMDQLERLEHVERHTPCVVDRLRKHSRILEPDYRVNPYRHWGVRISDFERSLVRLSDLPERGAFHFNDPIRHRKDDAYTKLLP